MAKSYNRTRLACYTGYVTQAAVVNLAPLLFVIFQDTFSVSLSYIAGITLATFLIQIAIDLCAVKFVEKTSYRFLAVSSQLTSAVGLVMLAFMPYIVKPEVGILISVLIYSSGSGLAEVVLSPLVEALPDNGQKGGSPLVLMHSFYSWGQAFVILVTTLLIKLIGGGLWYLLPLFWALIPIFNGICFARVPMIDMTVHDSEHKIGGMLKRPEFVIAFVLMVCAGASEQTMSQWASMFAEKGLGVTKLVGDILGPCLFACMMGMGRTLYGIVGGKVKLLKVLFACSAVTIVCYMITVFVGVPAVSLIACGFTGIGVCIMWPGMLDNCSAKFPGGGAAMFALLAFGGDLGCSLGPWLCGTVSDLAEKYGGAAEAEALRCGIFASSVFPVLMLVGVLLLLKGSRKEEIND